MSARSQPEQPPAPHRWPARATVAVAVVYQVFAISGLVGAFHQPTPGLLLMPHPTGAATLVVPTTDEAEVALRGHRAPVSLLAVNGEALPAVATGVDRLQRRLRGGRLGELNRFLLEDRRGERFTVTLALQREPSQSVFARRSVLNGLYHFGGLLYLAVGLLVWLRRPGDRAAWPLLGLCCLASVQMSFLVPTGPLAGVLGLLKIGSFPFWGVLALVLAFRFIGCERMPGARWVVRGSAALGLLLGVGGVLAATSARLTEAAPWLGRAVGAATGVFLIGLVLVMVVASLVEARAPRPIALRRRARVFAAAFLLSFLLPSVVIVLQAVAGVGGNWLGLLVMLSLSAFPLIVGYAIVRHQLFDLRLVLRRSVVYGLLSLLVSSAYVALALLSLRIVRLAPSPLFIGASVVALILVFGLVQVRVQRAVDRFVYRTRYVYADAIARASAGLTLDRNLETICDTVRLALVEAMGLRRVYLAVWESPACERLSCVHVGGKVSTDGCGEPPPGETDPAPLPERFAAAELVPVDRALRTVYLVSAHDLRAVAAQSEATDVEDSGSEGAFWSHYGIEAIIPLSLGAETSVSRVVGLLLLGSKSDGRPMDSEDQALLRTLANQLAVAIESVNALAEIQRLNDQLERRVAERTAELSRALEELKQAEGRLVESETQALLARLVAGILHEVNSPLGTVRSSVDTVGRVLERCRPALEASARDGGSVAGEPAALTRRALDALERGRDSARVALTSVERIGEVMDSLQRFVSLDEAEVKLLDVRRAMEDARTLIAPSLGEGVELAVEGQGTAAVPAVVRCEPAKVNRVFLNLLSNAVNAVNGEGTVRVTIERRDGLVLIDFVDDGEGIEASRLDELFDIGFTTKQGRVGLRLGLPSSKRWVEELGGSLSIESKLGEGTRVRVELPAADAEAAR